jgi:hypothetical protein
METVVRKDTTPNEVYVRRYKDFIRLMRIARMLQNARTTKNKNSNSKTNTSL